MENTIDKIKLKIEFDSASLVISLTDEDYLYLLSCQVSGGSGVMSKFRNFNTERPI